MQEWAVNALIPTPFCRDEIRISHLLFADDVMIFNKAGAFVAGNIKRLLEDEKLYAGMTANNGKSNVSFANYDESSKSAILSILNLKEKSLPVI